AAQVHTRRTGSAAAAVAVTGESISLFLAWLRNLSHGVEIERPQEIPDTLEPDSYLVVHVPRQGNDRHANTGGDQAKLDGCGARLIIQKLLQLQTHDIPPTKPANAPAIEAAPARTLAARLLKTI